MSVRRILGPSVAVLLALAMLGAAAEPVAVALESRGHATEAGDLEWRFVLTLTNIESKPRSLRVFVWACNDQTDPPPRGLWPLQAFVGNMTPGRELAVKDPSKGYLVELKAKERRKLEEAAIIVPTLGADRTRRVRDRRFLEYTLEVYDAHDGTLLLRRLHQRI